MPEKLVELKPLRETSSDYDEIESYLVAFFRKEIYVPLIEELGAKDLLKNSSDDLIDAIVSGRITFERGVFRGQFNSRVSKELKKLGAKWKGGAFHILRSDLPASISKAIDRAQATFEKKLHKIDDKLSKILPAEIAGKIRLEKLFDTVIWKADRRFQDTVSGLTVAPELSEEQRMKIAREYTENMRLYIKDWTEKEIVELRKRVLTTITAGNRYETLVKTIRSSYGVSQNKAKFLARQETSLLMAKFRETRYTDVGIKEYRWCNVVGSPKHPVRPMHKALNNKVFRWDEPPIVNEKGERKNPGEDYNCRCFARPIVRFK